MKRLLALAALLAVVATPLAAQDQSEIELTRKQIQSDRQTLVSAGMELTDEQAGKFWPVYSEYRAELKPIQDRHVELILGYAEQYGSVTDESAAAMLEELLSIKSETLDVQKKYVSKFEAVLPRLLVARFYQLENKLDAIIAYDLAMSIPVLQ
jgi:Spy/CpxP family protein refolding chaperone